MAARGLLAAGGLFATGLGQRIGEVLSGLDDSVGGLALELGQFRHLPGEFELPFEFFGLDLADDPGALGFAFELCDGLSGGAGRFGLCGLGGGIAGLLEGSPDAGDFPHGLDTEFVELTGGGMRFGVDGLLDAA